MNEVSVQKDMSSKIVLDVLNCEQSNIEEL